MKLGELINRIRPEPAKVGEYRATLVAAGVPKVDVRRSVAQFKRVVDQEVGSLPDDRLERLGEMPVSRQTVRMAEVAAQTGIDPVDNLLEAAERAQDLGKNKVVASGRRGVPLANLAGRMQRERWQHNFAPRIRAAAVVYQR